ncbi:MAG: Ig-like domain-containing protein [Deferribacteres bacterium]|nr:Ig-like domain-containing protein [candidate division KSB1 bacterium]MCB9501691.1 Ig-like domain-containing protein [Deferribacteres bacterium]
MPFKAVLSLIALALIAACASQRAPSGGPEDKTPPEIISTTPQSGAVRIPVTTNVELQYSEKIDRDTFFEAIFVSPDPGEVQIKHKRKRTILQFKDPLLKDRTYVITLGTTLRDAHNVSLEHSFTFAFSTGDSIDKGQIDGQVFDGRAQGVSVWAYILSDSTLIDPTKTSGDYSTQVGADGRFSIPFMADGTYRLYAVEDAGKTGVYNPMEDRIAMANRDVVIKAGQRSVKNLAFRLMRQDTLAPAINNIGMRDASTVEVKFSENITAADSQWTSVFTIGDTLQKSFIQIHKVARFPLDNKRFDLITDTLKTEEFLRFRTKTVMDTIGNTILPAFSFFDFESTTRADTVAPRIIRFLPEHTSANVAQDTTIMIYFNEWMQEIPDDSSFFLQDTLGSKIGGSGSWDNPFTYSFKPDTLLSPRTLYRFNFTTDHFHDRSGNALFDTSETRTFITINPDTLSSIAGTVHDSRGIADSSMTYYLTALQIENPAILYKTKTKNHNKYIFESMLPGRYIIQGFVDQNEDGKFSFGSVNPFVPAEYSFLYPDTVSIRSKWPDEGEDLIITD